jgi:hypothetical protein
VQNVLIDALPLRGLFLVIVASSLLFLEIGFLFGRWKLRRLGGGEREPLLGAMVGASLGLLGFMLAITFGMAAERYDKRRYVLVEEVNAIGTAYLRADVLTEPHRKEVRDLLREYVDVRLEAVRTGNLAPAVARSDELHQLLWARAMAAAAEHPTVMTGLFVQSLNAVIDAHTTRLTAGARSRIPDIIWTVLLAVTMLTMAGVGFYAGVIGAGRSIARVFLALTFAAVIALIADLDRPLQGFVRVSQQPMINLRNSMEPPAP